MAPLKNPLKLIKTKQPHAKYHVWVDPKGPQPTRLANLGGTTSLTLAQADWLYKEFKKGRFTGYRKRPISAKPAPLTLQERAWREMTRLVGVMEDPGHNNSGTHGVVTVNEIIHENKGDIGEPWCGDTVAHAYRVAGSKVVQRGWASTLQLGRLTGQKSIGIRSMQLGDIVVYDFVGGQSSDHTGLFGYYCDSDGTPVSAAHATHVYAIEGNTGSVGSVSDSNRGGDGVREKIRPIGLVTRGVRVLR